MNKTHKFMLLSYVVVDQ